MGYFNFNNKKIYYTEIGEGIPLLFLHGNTASSNMFTEIVELYKNDFKVILIDFLGHGKSDRLSKFSTDLWFDEANQVITFLKEKNYEKVNLIGCSGGALVAINVALEAPMLVNKVIADSFEGENPLKIVIDNIEIDRENSKFDENARAFYIDMHGDDFIQIVDNDTKAMISHAKEIGKFFHKDLKYLETDILLTGSKSDEFICEIALDYFEKTYDEMISKIGHGKIHLFETGLHPALITNQASFYKLSKDFFEDKI